MSLPTAMQSPSLPDWGFSSAWIKELMWLSTWFPQESIAQGDRGDIWLPSSMQILSLVNLKSSWNCNLRQSLKKTVRKWSQNCFTVNIKKKMFVSRFCFKGCLFQCIVCKVAGRFYAPVLNKLINCIYILILVYSSSLVLNKFSDHSHMLHI